MLDGSQETKDKHIKEFLGYWFEADYSWNGLKSKDWHEGKTVQEYWLSDPKTGALRTEEELKRLYELIEVDGQKTYHIAHLPLCYEDGTPTLKTNDPEKIQAQLDTIIRERLEASVIETVNNEPYNSSLAWFEGAVFLELDLSREIFPQALNVRRLYTSHTHRNPW